MGAVVMGDQALSFPLQDLIGYRADVSRIVTGLRQAAPVTQHVYDFWQDLEGPSCLSDTGELVRACRDRRDHGDLSDCVPASGLVPRSVQPRRARDRHPGLHPHANDGDPLLHPQAANRCPLGEHGGLAEIPHGHGPGGPLHGLTPHGHEVPRLGRGSDAADHRRRCQRPDRTVHLHRGATRDRRHRVRGELAEPPDRTDPSCRP